MALDKFVLDEKYTRRISSMAALGLVSIRADNRLYMSARLLDKLNIKVGAYADMYLDKDAMLLGIKFIDNKSLASPSALKVTYDYSGYVINITPILDTLHIIVPYAIRRPVDVADDMLTVSLEGLDKYEF